MEIPVTKVGALCEKKNWKPYKPHVTVPLAVARLAGRLVFCDWILQKPEGLKSMCLSDQKWFLLQTSPIKHNKRY